MEEEKKAKKEQSPHDALFKSVFGNTEHARPFFAAHLPADVLAEVRLSTLKVVPGSYVDDALSTRFSDLLFSIERLEGGPLYAYVLLEHQSSNDPLMAFRLLLYMVHVWEALLKENPKLKRLPPLVPVVVHHGAAEWTAPTAMRGIIERSDRLPEGVLRGIPTFEYGIVDLVRKTEESIGGSALGKVSLMALKSAHTGRLLGRLLGWTKLLGEILSREGGARELRAFIEYVLRVEEDDVTEETFRGILRQISQATREDTMNLVDVLEARGEARGKLSEARTAIRRVLGARGLSLSPDQERILGECLDLESLERWLVRAVTLTDPGQIFDR